MNKNTRLYSVISYLTWAGWLIALLARDKEDELVRRHLNQALVLNLAGLAGIILLQFGYYVWIVVRIAELFCFALSVMGIVRAYRMSDEPLPLIGSINLIE